MGIKLRSGFALMTEGVKTLKIVAVDYKEEFGKLRVDMKDKSGAKHFENFNFIGNMGTENEWAFKAFSGLVRAAMPDADPEAEIEPVDLVGKYVKGTIVHHTYTANDGTEKTTTRRADGTYWETPSAEDISTYEGVTPPADEEIDLDDIFKD